MFISFERDIIKTEENQMTNQAKYKRQRDNGEEIMEIVSLHASPNRGIPILKDQPSELHPDSSNTDVKIWLMK